LHKQPLAIFEQAGDFGCNNRTIAMPLVGLRESFVEGNWTVARLLQLRINVSLFVHKSFTRARIATHGAASFPGSRAFPHASRCRHGDAPEKPSGECRGCAASRIEKGTEP
jgi:hypothetical protein